VLKKLLQEKRSDILDNWAGKVLSTYSEEGAPFFKKLKDQFANPVGHKVKVGIAEIYDAILDQENVADRVYPIMKDLVMVRAVQTFKPSDAVSFIFDLKEVVLSECQKAGLADYNDELPAFYAKVDAVALLVFDLYMASRERIYQIRIRELKSGAYVLTDSACPSALMRENRKKRRN
jgi:hypothetical protein